MCRLLKTLCKDYQFKQIIKNLTHITNRSSTLIDHFTTNRPERITNCGSLVVGFNDHVMVFGMCKISGNLKKEPKTFSQNCHTIRTKKLICMRVCVFINYNPVLLQLYVQFYSNSIQIYHFQAQT